jgi:hypothetical protein
MPEPGSVHFGSSQIGRLPSKGVRQFGADRFPLHVNRKATWFFGLSHFLRKTGAHPGSSPGQACSGKCSGAHYIPLPNIDIFGCFTREDRRMAGPTIAELDARIAAVRQNINDLVEQAAAYSGAADESRIADRIASQEQELARLRKLRDSLSQ